MVFRVASLIPAVACASSAAAQGAWLTVYGISHDVSSMGSEVCSAGDVDQDGVTDVAAQAYAQGEWHVLIFSGENGQLLRTYHGSDTSKGFGRAMAAGDLDLDGREDLVVSDFLDDAGGTVFVFSGADGSLLWSAVGDLGSAFGRSLAVVADIDQDGHPEILVGSPEYGPADGKGRFAVLSGDSGTQIRSVEANAETDGLGRAVCDVGDADGDGVSDYAVAAGDGALPLDDAGVVYLYSAASGTLLREWHGDPDDQHLGSSLAGAGDLDQDGFADLLVGAPRDDLAGPGSGSVFVLSGSDGSLLRTHTGSATDQEFGTEVAALGDIDGDGRPDYAVSAPLDDSNGVDSGSVWAFSGVDGTTLSHVTGDGPELRWGTGLSEMPDMDGDGYDDWAAGASTDHPAHSLGGYARVWIAGCAAGGAAYCETSPNSAGAGARMGFRGTTSLAANDLVLTVDDGAHDQYGFFFYGPLPQSVPAGDGRLCVHAGILKLFRILPAVQTDGMGGVSLALDNTAPPMGSGPGAFEPGDTWYFQYCYRDPGGPLGSRFNFSDGLMLRFCR